MKKNINLLYKKSNYRRAERMFLFLRRATYILAGGVLLSVLALFMLTTRQNTQYEALLKAKQKLVEDLISKQEIETKLAYISGKMSLIKSLEAKNPNYLKYYHIIEAALPTGSESVKINSFVIDESRTMSATILFLTKADLYTFMDTIERAEFADKFQSLSVDGASISDAQFTQLGGVTIMLTGTFKKI